MKYLIFLIAAAAGYLLSGLNPAIILSKAIYKKDIRNEGSGNPGFSNFKRVFGGKYAWFVFILDILKGVILALIFGYAFKQLWNDRALGVAYTTIFAVLGHAYPVWYKFKGGKGFLVCLSSLWFMNWIAGLIGTLIMVVLLITVKYMSLATMVSLIIGALLLPLFSVPLIPSAMYLLCVLFMIYRHKDNIKRLFSHSETKFYIFKDKS